MIFVASCGRSGSPPSASATSAAKSSTACTPPTSTCRSASPVDSGTGMCMWEVTGTAHFDWYGLSIGPADTGDGQGAVQNLAAMQNPPHDPGTGRFNCNLAINTGPAHWVLDAAVDALNQWPVN